MSVPRLVIVAYRPKPGQEPVLLAELRDHVHVLRSEGLATDRPVIHHLKEAPPNRQGHALQLGALHFKGPQCQSASIIMMILGVATQ